MIVKQLNYIMCKKVPINYITQIHTLPEDEIRECKFFDGI